MRQDFHVKILTTNLTAMLANTAQKQVDNTCNKRILKYKINFAQALSKVKNRIVQWLQIRPDQLRYMLSKFIDYIALTIEPVRDGRSYARPKSKMKNRKFYSAYKRAV